VVFHLAALIGIPFSYHSPDSYVDTNIRGTLNVLQAARKLSVEKVLSTSTSEVYGTARYVPIDEAHPFQGQSPYSATKIGADRLVESFWRSFELPTVIVRPFNTYGPRQSARAVIPTLITQLLDGAQEIKMGSLSPTRDFVFVKDTVLFMRRNTNAFIAHRNRHMGGMHFTKDSDLATIHRVFYRITDKIVKNLIQTTFIAPNGGKIGWKFNYELMHGCLGGELAHNGRCHFGQHHLITNLQSERARLQT